jgi:hypothetical protein
MINIQLINFTVVTINSFNKDLKMKNTFGDRGKLKGLREVGDGMADAEGDDCLLSCLSSSASSVLVIVIIRLLVFKRLYKDWMMTESSQLP